MKSHHISESDKDAKSLSVYLGIFYNSIYDQPKFMNRNRN